MNEDTQPLLKDDNIDNSDMIDTSPMVINDNIIKPNVINDDKANLDPQNDPIENKTDLIDCKDNEDEKKPKIED